MHGEQAQLAGPDAPTPTPISLSPSFSLPISPLTRAPLLPRAQGQRWSRLNGARRNPAAVTVVVTVVMLMIAAINKAVVATSPAHHGRNGGAAQVRVTGP